MGASEALLGVIALAIGLLLAWRSGPVARWVLFGSAMLVSGLLFLPGEQITGLAGKEAVSGLRNLADATPWDISDWTHFVLFVWLGLMVWIARPDLRGWKIWMLVGFLAIAAELGQGLAPGRAPRVDDVALNVAGGTAGVLLGILIGTLRKNSHKPLVEKPKRS